MNEREAIEERLRGLLRNPGDWSLVADLLQRHHAASAAPDAWRHTAKLAGLGTLIAGIAHEINNPAHVIGTDLDLLQRALPALRAIVDEYVDEHGAVSVGGLPWPMAGERLAQAVSDARGGAERIRGIVHDLLDHARPDEHDHSAAIDLNRSIMAVINLLGGELRRGGHRCQVELQPLLPAVRGHQRRIEQVLLNLIRNAAEACGERPGHIRIRTGSDDGQVYCSIADDGPGMDAATLARATEPFFTTRRGHGGNGLGLWLCRSLIDDHGGHFCLDSAPGEGCTASFSLPREAAAAPRQH